MRPNVKARHRYNLQRSREAGFVDDMSAEIRRCMPRVVRIHVAGDYMDAAYAESWLRIARRCPDSRFLSYSRSWAVPDIREVLRRMAVEDNFFCWYSTDRDSGPAPRDPGVRHAYMLMPGEDEAAIPVGTDLVFRVRDRTPRKWAGPAMVCPAENGIALKNGHMTCSRCSVCFSRSTPRPKP